MKDKALMFFGHFNPPTETHLKVLLRVSREAEKRKSDAFVFLSVPFNNFKHPLTSEFRKEILLKMFEENGITNINVVADPKLSAPFVAMNRLYIMGYKDVDVLAYDNTRHEYEEMFREHNSSTRKMDKIEVFTVWPLDPDRGEVKEDTPYGKWIDRDAQMNSFKMRAFVRESLLNQPGFSDVKKNSFMSNLGIKNVALAEKVYVEMIERLGEGNMVPGHKGVIKEHNKVYLAKHYKP